tara:strand:- start:30 stop:503 length:474 start_codon:yes stop_codon:yes gene_type:complete
MRANAKRAIDELTAQQRLFVQELLGGAETLTAAYRAAYKVSKMTADAVRVEASRLKKHPKVALALEEGRAAEERRMLRDGANKRRGVISRLDSIADDEESPSASRVAALRLIGLELGMFKERTAMEVSGPAPDSESATLLELENTLREALDSGHTEQ